ncbi:MAG: T9SS type A sorting domain-containing protein [Prevotella sp.]|nr:T9SS type A sorting domain-containing protein [Prevotella sp.]
MRKPYAYILLLAATLMGSLQAKAQTLLEEDFETSSTETFSQPIAVGAGWTTVDSYNGSKQAYRWHNYYSDKGTIGGTHVAGCDAPTYESDPNGGFGPKEEVLLTPELNLDNTYELTFTFIVSPMNAYETSMYDLQVRVVEDGDLANAETVFSIQNQAMLKESGVLTYPITTWDPHTAKISLEDWQGKKVKLAFVHKMMTKIANVAWLDDVSVKQHTPDTAPVAVLSTDRYNFGDVYVGEKHYTDFITLTNQGKNGLKITGFDFPEGVSTPLDASMVNLDKYESVSFRLAYTASLTSPATANAVIHTNGGDVTITLQANKQVVPEGYTLETFEKYFPPAGWKNRGWDARFAEIEGDVSAYATGSLDDNYLTSPRLDLTDGGSVTFTYRNIFDSELGDTYQMNDISVEVSYDGGETWVQKWIFDYQLATYSETVTVDLGKGTDNSYIRWKNSAISYDDEGVDEFADFYFDRVLLPKLFGADDVPCAAYLIKPAVGATDIYPKNVELQWGPAQFAMGYKLYVGSNSAANDLIDGLDLHDALSYTIPECAYETTYRWKVVPYNSYGNTPNREVTTWNFTTQPDASNVSYPYEEDFAKNTLPNGWLSTEAVNSYNRTWYVNTYYPYVTDQVTSNALTSSYLNEGDENSVTTQEFKLPDDAKMAISFVWGDEHPSDLVVDPTGMVKKHNVEPNNGVSEGIFQIGVDGEWITLSTISENSFNDEEKCWINEKFDLGEYAGKTVQFRWIHKSYNSGRDGGTSLAHVVIEELQGDKAVFNKREWNAGKVNYNKAVNSGAVFTILNRGTNDLKVKRAYFGTQNFTSSIEAGTVIAPEEGYAFSMQFDALDAASLVEDALTVEFESGYTVTFPVKGEGMAADVLYYAFEDNPLDYPWTDFTTIDADNQVSYAFGSWWIDFEKSGQKFAFWPGDDDKMNGIMSPVSGHMALVAASPIDGSADNWIVSKQLHATNQSTFNFWVRNWECLQSVLPAPNHRVSVLVAESNPQRTSSFTTVMGETEVPFLDWDNWQNYEVDLSAYAGRDIYIAVRHTTNGASNVAFFDDFTFNHFTNESGIQAVSSIDEQAEVSIYTINGALVKKGVGTKTLQSLAKGVYVVRIKNGETVTTQRVVKK